MTTEKRKLDEIKSDIDEHFLCAVCFDLIFKPKVGRCGHSFCAECAIQTRGTCPTCRKITTFTDNWQLGKIIAKTYPEQYETKKKLNTIEGYCQHMTALYPDFFCLFSHEKFDVESLVFLKYAEQIHLRTRNQDRKERNRIYEEAGAEIIRRVNQIGCFIVFTGEHESLHSNFPMAIRSSALYYFEKTTYFFITYFSSADS